MKKSYLIQMKDILFIGGPKVVQGVERINDDLVSILTAEGLYDRKSVVVWPTESFLSQPDDPAQLAAVCNERLAELIAIYEKKLIPFGGVSPDQYRELVAEVRRDTKAMDEARDICVRSQAYATLSKLLLAVTGGQNLVVVISPSATTKSVSWLTHPGRFDLGHGQYIKAYKSSDSGYGVLNAVKDWPLAFHGFTPGIVKAGDLVPQTTFNFNGEKVFCDTNSYLGVENALTADMEVSFPVTDRFGASRAVKVSTDQGYMLIVPEPGKMRNFVIGLKTGKVKQTEPEAVASDDPTSTPAPEISSKALNSRSVDEEWITVKEAAEMLKCSDKTIRNYYGDGRLKHQKVGERKVLILKSSVDKLLEG